MNTPYSDVQSKHYLSHLTLPLFITKQNKYSAGVVLGLIAAFLYLVTNHIHVFQPQFLPMAWIDVIIPFLPYTVWIYLSEYFFFFVVYISCRDLVNLNKYFYSFLSLQIVSVAIFWLWPTTYPRELFPLPASLDRVTYFFFNALREADTPANCCPSLHVSSVYLSTFLFLRDQRKKFPFFLFWGTAIALSTLTTKQHYLIDVVTGFTMAILFYWLFYKHFNYRQVGISKNSQK